MNHESSDSSRLRKIVSARPVILGLITALVLLTLYAAGGFLLAPWLLQKQLPELADTHLGARGSVSSVRINPFLLTLEATDLVIAEKNGVPALQVGRVFVDLESGSLLRRTWAFREIRIDKPIVSANLDANESLNLARLFAPKSAKAVAVKTTEAAIAEPLPQVLLQHLVVTGGVFSFDDQTVTPAARAQFNPVNIEMHDVSNLPEHRGEHIVTARLPGGGNLQWRGKFTLAPAESSGSITLKDAKLATLWRFMRDHLAIIEPAGVYDLALRYRLRDSKGGYVLQADDLSLQIKDVALAQQNGGATLGKLATIVIADGNVDLRKRTLTFKNVALSEGTINLALDENGIPDWVKLINSKPDKFAAPEKTADATEARPWQIDLPKITIGPLALSISDRSRIRPLQVTIASAQAAFGVAVTTGTATQVNVNNGAISLGDMQVHSGDSKMSLITLTNADLTGATFNLQEKSVRADLLRLSGGATLVERGADGNFTITEAFTPRQPAPDSGYKFGLDRLEIAGYAVPLADRAMEPALAYDLVNIQAKVEKLTYPPQGKYLLELTSQIEQGGALQAKGTVDMFNRTADVRVNAGAVTLAPVAGLIGRHTTLSLATGNVGTEGRLVWNGRSNPATLRYTGTAAVSDVDLRTGNAAERLVSWQRLAATGLDYSLSDNRMSIAELQLSQPYAKLMINKDRSTNFSGLLRPDKAAADPAAAKPVAARPLAITLEHVKVERGAMDFSDRSLVMPFATHIKALNGSANGLSFTPDSRANLKLEGRVGDYGLARAEGAFQILAPKKFTDITVSFRNVALPLLSPYTATFAGRRIDAGKLALDLQYKINNSDLAGENKILLEKVVLGERVKSPSALDLPLDLAIALLTDSEGKIDLAVPVTGNVDNPQFDYGDIIAKAISSALTGIVTAPFRALGAIFGGNAETLGDIVFDPGSARILPTEYEKLRRVAEGLQKRPQLKLLVQGTYHSQKDSYALRTTQVRSDLAAREGFKLAPNEDPGPVGFSSAKTQRALEELFGDAAGNTDAVAQFAASFGTAAGREVRRVNPLLASTGDGAGDPALYENLYDKLIEQKTLPPSALPDLARARAETVTAAFIKRLKFDAVRLGNSPPAATTEVTDNGVPVKLSFAPIN